MRRLALILAGGSGDRFWPASKDDYPKQFLEFFSGKSLIQLTYERLLSFFDRESIFVSTSPSYVDNVRRSLYIDERNIIVEPEKRNTAPAISYSMRVLKERTGLKDFLVGVFPSDALIMDYEDPNPLRVSAEFLRKVGIAFEVAKDGYLVLLGIKPDRPDPNYGYIMPGPSLSFPEVYRIKKFVEKPSVKKARRYIRKGYLWNSGMFFWSFTVFETELKSHAPIFYRSVFESDFPEQEYLSLPRTSIDYALMEKTNRAAVVKTNFLWDDLGNWLSLAKYGFDRGDFLKIDSPGTLVFNMSEDYKVVLLEVSNIGVVVANGVVYVLNLSSSARTREIKRLVSNGEQEEKASKLFGK